MTGGNPRCDILQYTYYIDMMTYSSKRKTDFEENENLVQAENYEYYYTGQTQLVKGGTWIFNDSTVTL
jgi:hypothetical protein